MAGTLLDLAERGQRVQLTLMSGAGGDSGVDGVVQAVGSDVAVVARTEVDVTSVALACHAHGVHALPLVGDVADRSFVEAAVASSRADGAWTDATLSFTKES